MFRGCRGGGEELISDNGLFNKLDELLLFLILIIQVFVLIEFSFIRQCNECVIFFK